MSQEISKTQVFSGKTGGPWESADPRLAAGKTTWTIRQPCSPAVTGQPSVVLVAYRVCCRVGHSPVTSEEGRARATRVLHPDPATVSDSLTIKKNSAAISRELFRKWADPPTRLLSKVGAEHRYWTLTMKVIKINSIYLTTLHHREEFSVLTHTPYKQNCSKICHRYIIQTDSLGYLYLSKLYTVFIKCVTEPNER